MEDLQYAKAANTLGTKKSTAYELLNESRSPPSSLHFRQITGRLGCAHMILRRGDKAPSEWKAGVPPGVDER